LSGGVDSSLITAFAARVSSGPVRTYNVSFPGHGIYDESAHAKLIATHFGTRHTDLVAEPASIELLPKLARQYDEPIGDSSMIPTYLISQLVRESCTVALGGDGGDELFGGYTHYRRYLNQMRFRAAMPSLVKSAAAMAGTLLPKGFRGRNYVRGMRRPDAEGWVEATLHFDSATRRELAPLTRELAGEIPESHRKRAGEGGRSLLQRMTRSDFQTYLPEDILVKVDRSSMLASLEMRAPFLDYRILDFAFGRVPDDLRATDREQKILLRRLARRVLPPETDIGRKQGFSIPLDAWFAQDWGSYISSVLREAPPALFAPRAMERLLSEQSRGYALGQRLFNLAFLELWRREHDVTLPA
jgi:asparagine synthase (glutamine-hydrolysing)